MTASASLNELIEPVVTTLGLEFWGVEHTAQDNRKIVRVFIDGENGVSVDDCAAVSRQLSALFDVEDPIPGVYTLEVSSPGVERPLFTAAQFQQYIGHEVKVKLRAPFEGRRNYRGLLSAVENDEISVHVDGHEYLLPIETVDKANLVYQFD